MRQFAALFAALAAHSVAHAASVGVDSPAPVVTGHAESRLVPERTGVAPGETLWLGLAQRLEPGWHVYWRNPGDSGLPLDLKWRLPRGFVAGEVRYPTPERIPVGPLANFGHSGDPVFLLPIEAPANARLGEIVTIGVKVTWLICADICVPEEAAFELRVPILADALPHPVGSPIVEEARAHMPTQAVGASRFFADARSIVFETSASEGARSGFFFPYGEGLIEPAAPQDFKIVNGRLRVTMKRGFSGGGDLTELAGVLAIETPDGLRRGIEIRAERAENAIGPAARPAGDASGIGDLPRLALAAFFGGLILNLMPCVFPILFIKAASLAGNAGGDRAAARLSGLAYGAGVVAMFAALGGLLIALRAGGEAIGWGFHLQSPTIVLLSAYLLFLVGLNLAGVFHVGETLQAAAGARSLGQGAAGSFATGALAVFVAAPCIGPLLAAPMGAALLAPPIMAMAIFLALALGFAAPFSVLALAPGLARLLPRPGAWMVVFREAMAFPVFGAAAFFLWVLARQTGTNGLALALAGGVAIAFAAWLFEKSKQSRRGLWLRAAALVAMAASLAPAMDLRLVETASASEYGDIEAEPFSAAHVATLRAGGAGVFVDFTAAWCITCQVNKRTVLSRRSLAAAFASRNVALLTADWTLRDPEITAALEGFGASGVPLYVYYPPTGDPKIIPQPLTEAAILAALQS